jgi:uncharacterized RDD family membrane protein YckC
LNNRRESCRAPQPKGQRSALQSHLPFTEQQEAGVRQTATVEERARPAGDFSFTIAIGRYSPPSEKRDRDGRMLIDVSTPPTPSDREDDSPAPEETSKHHGLYAVAPIGERRLAAVLDTLFLLFGYGGFLALFSSLGGQFTLSKLSAAVYVATFVIVYMQYFALFTVFGGTTPGMMFRGLQVTSFSGEAPTPRQMLLRSVGYLISAGTLFMGFMWACWDEDMLTWHDRLSRTYLTSPETRTQMNNAVRGR